MGRRAVVGTGRAWRGSGEGGGDGGGEGGGKAQARKVVIGGGDGRGDRDGEMAEERAPPRTPAGLCSADESGPQEAEEPDAETRARRRGPRSYHVAAALSPRSLIHISNSSEQVSEVSFTRTRCNRTSNLYLNLSPHREDLTAYNSNVQSRIRRVGMAMTHAVWMMHDRL